MPADIRRRHHGQLTIAQAAKLIGTLKEDEKEILDTLANKIEISGRLESSENVAVFNFWPRREGRKPKDKVYNRVEGALTPIRSLVRAGWLRFADIMGEGFGNFYMTEEGERVWTLRR